MPIRVVHFMEMGEAAKRKPPDFTPQIATKIRLSKLKEFDTPRYRGLFPGSDGPGGVEHPVAGI